MVVEIVLAILLRNFDLIGDNRIATVDGVFQRADGRNEDGVFVGEAAIGHGGFVGLPPNGWASSALPLGRCCDALRVNLRGNLWACWRREHIFYGTFGASELAIDRAQGRLVELIGLNAGSQLVDLVAEVAP